MFEFDATPYAGTCAELDALAARLDDRIMARRWTGRLRRTLEAEAIGASTRMEGVPVTVSDVQRILAGDRPAAVTEQDGALVEGYAAAMTYAQRRADDGALAWTPELLIGLHDRIVAGRPDHGAGRLRNGAAWVAGPDGSVVFAPPDAELLSGLVQTLCHTAEAADWHPAVASAWLHVGLAAVHPFRDGNGRTARVIASLAMYRGGFHHPAFTSLEEWWGRYPEKYYAAFSCLGDRFDATTDVSPFISTHVEAQLQQAVVLALRQRTEGELWITLENLLEDRGLPTRLANALYDAFFGRDVTTGYYSDLTSTSVPTARNDLTTAVAAGLMTAEGRTRGRRYLAGPRLLVEISTALGGVAVHPDAVIQELVRRGREGVIADRRSTDGR